MKLFYLLSFLFISTMLLGQKDSTANNPWEDFDAPTSKNKKIATFIKKGFPKKLNKAIGELVLIPGGTFGMGQMPEGIDRYPQMPSREGIDTFLISIPARARRTTISSFIIGATEVTNLQYREFVYWVRDSIAHQLMGHVKESPNGDQIDWEQELDWSADGPLAELFYKAGKQLGSKKSIDVSKLIYASGDYKKDKAVQVYPDTLCWLRDFTYSYNEPMTRNNFWNSDFDNFPVVGVSWDQAMAYCDWKTHQINKLLTKHGYSPLQLRLPTEAEWEYAALALEQGTYAKDERISHRKLFPWQGSELTDEKGNYLANFGAIYDETGDWIKPFQEGDISASKYRKNSSKKKTAELGLGLYTTPVKQYAAYGGLYGMAGNVSEWVMDVPLPIWEGSSISKEVEMHDLNPFRGNFSPQEKDSSTTTIIEEEPMYNDSVKYILYQADSVEVMRYFFDQWRANINNTNRMSLEDQFYMDVYYFKNYWHDIKVIYRSGAKKRIGKGGSWAESNVNLYPGARATYTQSHGYSFVGFRVAATFSLSNE